MKMMMKILSEEMLQDNEREAAEKKEIQKSLLKKMTKTRREKWMKMKEETKRKGFFSSFLI